MFQQEQSMIVNYDVDTVYEAVLKGAESLKFAVKNANPITHSISLGVGMSLISWGEQLLPTTVTR